MLRRTHVLASIIAAVAVAAPALAADSYQPGATALLSRSDGFGDLPAQSDGNSRAGAQAISDDGRFVAFVSGADDLGAPGDASTHAYVRDDQTGAVTLLDRAGAGGPVADNSAYSISISRDGSHACFTSAADNLVAGVSGRHIYVVTVASGAIVVGDRATGGALGNNDADRCVLDADGNTVAFDSYATNLAPGVANGTHVYARHLDSSTTQLVDIYQGSPGNGSAYGPTIDAAGTRVAFETGASNLNGAGGDANGHMDVYVRPLAAVQPTLVSLADGAGPIGNGDSTAPSISADGNLIAFASTATNLGDGDADSTRDIHVRDVAAATTRLVSRADGVNGAKANIQSDGPVISGDGSAVAFVSGATNLGADPGQNDEGPNQLAYLRTLDGHTSVLNRASGAAGAISQSWVGSVALDLHATNAVFSSTSAQLDPLANGTFEEVFQRHLAGGFETRLISRPVDASQRPAPISEVDGGPRALSADGRFAVFTADSAFGGAPGMQEVYVRDILLGTTRLVSRLDGADGAPADGGSGDAAISADGTKVAFASASLNLPGGDGVHDQVYVRDLASGRTTLVSTGAGGTGNGGSGQPVLSQDGSKVAFNSWASNLVAGDGNNVGDVFVRDMAAGTTVMASLTAAGGEPDDQSRDAMISADGTRVGFTSYAKNMGFGGPNDGTQHLYVRDLAAGTTALVDRYADGKPGDKSADRVSMSADGNRFLFSSSAKLTPDAPIADDAFVRDVAAGTTTLVGLGPNGEQSSKQVFPLGISMDGRKITFSTYADSFGAGTLGGGWIRDLASGTTAYVGFHDGGAQPPAGNSFQGVSMDADGNCFAFESDDGNLASPSYAGRDISLLWLRDVAGECPVHAPDTTITSGPDGKTKVREAYSVFGYQADESGATFTCSLDSAPMKPCGDTFHTGALPDGVHRFAVVAKDRAGNVDPTPALVTFTVGVPPRITKLRLDRRGRLVFKLSEKATVRVRLARTGRAHSARVGELTIKRSLKGGTRRIKLPLKRLRSGRYRATVTATDAGGNRSVPKRKSFDVRR
jgi:Tol biopolymer transport system component